MKKTYTITVEEDGDKCRMHRTCDGFSPIELLGILEYVQMEIKQQMGGELKPDIVKREVVEEEKQK